MSKPIREVEIKTVDEKKAVVHAVLDTGSFYTIIRENVLPSGARPEKRRRKKTFGTASRGGKLSVTGAIVLEMKIEGHWVEGEALVAPELGSDMLIGAGLMQMWDISIKNKNGHTTPRDGGSAARVQGRTERPTIHVGRDMQDPDIQTVL